LLAQQDIHQLQDNFSIVKGNAMNKLFFVFSCAVIATGFNAVIAADRQDTMPMPAGTADMKMKSSTEMMNKDMMHKNGMNMKSLDTNNDGMISKQEFMTHHEKMYDSMKKNKDGMVDLKDMGMGMGMGGEKGMMSDAKK
jgi:hypothetical protein